MTAILARYAAGLALILSTWGSGTLTTMHHFAALLSENALIALTVPVLIWAGICAAHFLSTGNASPPTPATEPRPAPPAPPQAALRLVEPERAAA